MNSIERCALAGAILVASVAPLARVEAQAMKVKEQPPKVLKPTSELITAEQLTSRTFPDVYQAIEALHSNWLRARNLNPRGGSLINPDASTTSKTASAQPGGTSSTASGMPRDASGVQVYLDGTRLGGIDMLKGIPVVTVYSIKHINGPDAQARFGIGHGDGVIYIATAAGK